MYQSYGSVMGWYEVNSLDVSTDSVTNVFLGFEAYKEKEEDCCNVKISVSISIYLCIMNLSLSQLERYFWGLVGCMNQKPSNKLWHYLYCRFATPKPTVPIFRKDIPTSSSFWCPCALASSRSTKRQEKDAAHRAKMAAAKEKKEQPDAKVSWRIKTSTPLED